MGRLSPSLPALKKIAGRIYFSQGKGIAADYAGSSLPFPAHRRRKKGPLKSSPPVFLSLQLTSLLSFLALRAPLPPEKTFFAPVPSLASRAAAWEEYEGKGCWRERQKKNTGSPFPFSLLFPPHSTRKMHWGDLRCSSSPFYRTGKEIRRAGRGEGGKSELQRSGERKRGGAIGGKGGGRVKGKRKHRKVLR